MDAVKLNNSSVYLTAVFLSIAALAILFISNDSRIWKKFTLLSGARARLPDTEIVDLRVYPIKSCRGFSVQSIRLLKTGLDLDRQWMFIDPQTRKFLTIRQLSKITLINTELSAADDTLHISIRDTPIRVAIAAHPSSDWLKANTTLSSCVIWGHDTDGWEYPAALTAPISDFLGQEVRLVRKGPTPRILSGNASPTRLGRTQDTNFPDILPVLVASAASMAELSSRLATKAENEFSIERFRPNIVVRGNEPWSEDSWKTVRIGGSTVLDVVARCARCRVPNVDPDTAEAHAREPWDTMMKYRRVDEGSKYKPCFGMLCVPREEAELCVGARFEILETTELHHYR